MNKNELVSEMASKSGLTKKEAAAALDAFVEAVENAVVKGDKVQLVGFGSFVPTKRAARTGKNPRTGEAISIPESKSCAWKIGADFKKKF